MIKSIFPIAVMVFLISISFVSSYETEKLTDIVEIRFPDLVGTHDIGELASLQSKDPEDLVNIKVTNHIGTGKVKLMIYELVNYSYEEEYPCKCVPIGNLTTVSCQTCTRFVPKYKNELVELDPKNLEIDKDTIIYEVFDGCDTIGTMPDGSKGCSIWTDVYVLEEIVGASWFNISWRYKIPIYINQTLTGSDNLINFPVNVSYDLTKLINDSKLDVDGKCLRFINDSETGFLDWEWEDYDSPLYGINGIAQMWVKVEKLEPNNTTLIFMYYDNDCDTDQWGNDTVNTWSYYNFVYHSSLDYDSLGITGIINNGSKQEYGQFASSNYYFNSDKQTLFIGNSALQFDTLNFTIEYWFSFNYSGVLSTTLHTLNYDTRPYLDHYSLVDNTVTYAMRDDASSGGQINPPQTLNDGNFHHIFILKNETNAHVFVDGIHRGSINGFTSNFNFDRNWSLGMELSGALPFTGYIDEFRVTKNKPISYSWVNRSYQQDLIWFGAEENITPTPPEEPNISVSNLTVQLDLCCDLPIRERYCNGSYLITIREITRCYNNGLTCELTNSSERQICHYGCYEDVGIYGAECSPSRWEITLQGLLIALGILIIIFIFTFFKTKHKRRY